MASLDGTFKGSTAQNDPLQHIQAEMLCNIVVELKAFCYLAQKGKKCFEPTKRYPKQVILKAQYNSSIEN